MNANFRELFRYIRVIRGLFSLRRTHVTINKGRNRELLIRSEHRAGYAEFVARVQENEKTLPLAQAVTEAVRGT